MATLTPILTGGNGIPTYNVGIAETHSWIPVANDQNRAMYARATYAVNSGQGQTVTSNVVSVSASSVGVIPIGSKGWVFKVLTGTGTLNTGGGAITLSAGFSDSDLNTLTNTISYSTGSNSTAYVRYNS